MPSLSQSLDGKQVVPYLAFHLGSGVELRSSCKQRATSSAERDVFLFNSMAGNTVEVPLTLSGNAPFWDQ